MSIIDHALRLTAANGGLMYDQYGFPILNPLIPGFYGNQQYPNYNPTRPTPTPQPKFDQTIQPSSVSFSPSNIGKPLPSDFGSWGEELEGPTNKSTTENSINAPYNMGPSLSMAGTITGLAAGVPGLGLGLGALGTARDVYQANKDIDEANETFTEGNKIGKLGVGDYLSALVNSASLGLLGTSVAEKAAMNKFGDVTPGVKPSEPTPTEIADELQYAAAAEKEAAAEKAAAAQAAEEDQSVSEQAAAAAQAAAAQTAEAQNNDQFGSDTSGPSDSTTDTSGPSGPAADTSAGEGYDGWAGDYAKGGAVDDESLPMDEKSRVERAEENNWRMDIPLYHATAYDFNNFVPSKWRGATYLSPSGRGAMSGAAAGAMEHMALSGPTVAGTKREGMRIIPVVIRGKIFGHDPFPEEWLPPKKIYRSEWKNIRDDWKNWNPPNADKFTPEELKSLRYFRVNALDSYDTEDNFLLRLLTANESELEKMSEIDEPMQRGNTVARAFSYEDIEGPHNHHRREALKKAGYTGAIVNDEGGDSVAIFDPRNIRSRFAKFDPKKKDSSDLLAASGGRINDDDDAMRRALALTAKAQKEGIRKNKNGR